MMAKLGVSASAEEFNVLLFEKKLQALKDSQESINSCCHWCLENRQHHKKIVTSWLNVLKHVKVEQRLTLFYLANDVIQYSKRKNYDFVESWSTSLQKATPLVRDEKVKHKILRIFTIWQQRGVYGEEFITDLSGLISASPPIRKNEDPHEFESQYLITKIRNCTKLETDTDTKLKKFKEHNPKILSELENNLFANLKDRAHVDDVEKEINEYATHMEGYITALKAEIKARNHLISLLTQADSQLDKDKKDVKLVANAYKTYATRIKGLKKKLDELKPKLESPPPSPDVNAPSPSPEDDSEEEKAAQNDSAKKGSYSPDFSAFSNPGFYNPVTANSSATAPSGNNNGFSSFMGGNAPFNLSNLFTNNSVTTESGVYNSSFTARAPPPPPSNPNQDYTYSGAPPQVSAVPLAPPPIPLFNKTEPNYQNQGYQGENFAQNPDNFGQGYDPNGSFNSGPFPDNNQQNYGGQNYGNNSFSNSFTGDEYNPEEQPENWDTQEIAWNDSANMESPSSPGNSFDYIDGISTQGDRDLRTLPVVPDITDDSSNHRGMKDVDHRNLISLTGSPHEGSNHSWMGGNNTDRDYRTPPADKDYRMPFNVASLTLPPPPPPPRSAESTPPAASTPVKKLLTPSPRKLLDKVEEIDMELSDDEAMNDQQQPCANDNLRQVPLVKHLLSPPPPLPELPEDYENEHFPENDGEYMDFPGENFSGNNWPDMELNVSMEGPPMQGPGFRGRGRMGHIKNRRGDYRPRSRGNPNRGFRGGRNRNNWGSSPRPRGQNRGRPYFRNNSSFRPQY